MRNINNTWGINQPPLTSTSPPTGYNLLEMVDLNKTHDVDHDGRTYG